MTIEFVFVCLCTFIGRLLFVNFFCVYVHVLALLYTIAGVLRKEKAFFFTFFSLHFD